MSPSLVSNDRRSLTVDDSLLEGSMVRRAFLSVPIPGRSVSTWCGPGGTYKDPTCCCRCRMAPTSSSSLPSWRVETTLEV